MQWVIMTDDLKRQIYFNSLLSGSKLIRNRSVDEIPDHEILMLNREYAEKQYEVMFDSNRRIYKRFKRDEIEQRKNNLDTANKMLVQYSHV